MDFLVLFLFYLVLVLVGSVMICICSKTHYLKGLVSGGAQVTMRPLDFEYHLSKQAQQFPDRMKKRCHFYSFVHLFHLWQLGYIRKSLSLSPWGFVVVEANFLMML